ncbi:MAG: type II and III secretion system protein family protein, partial [Candidatus Acidiferrales bacterium]
SKQHDDDVSERCRLATVFHAGIAVALLLLAAITAVARPRSPSSATTGSRTPVGRVAALPASGAPLAAAAPATSAGQATESTTANVSSLHLLVGQSRIITTAAKIKRVSLADPTLAEAIVVSPYQLMLNGKAPGDVSLVIWDESDRSQQFDVSVEIDVASLRQELRDAFPAESVQIEATKGTVIVLGKISSSAVEEKILEVVKGSADKVVDLMQVPTPETGEILLQVKFAEVDRTALKQLGINILSLPGAKNVGSISTQQFSPAMIQGAVGTLGGGSGSSTTSTTTTTSPAGSFGLSDLLNLFIYRQDINLAATIQALQSNNLLQILAEPNLLTESGKDASFLAGGEFPFPVVQSTGGGFPTITIQFKEFGVRLNFTPTITPDGLIHLKVMPEVSALDFSNALTIEGFQIPALSTRRVESEMELRDGQSFAIAGLMDNRVTEQLSKIPGIGDIPILGDLFKSKSLQKSDDELLIVVTPRIMHPLADTTVPPGPVFPQPFLPPATPNPAALPDAPTPRPN